jgi:hypothetical protein
MDESPIVAVNDAISLVRSHAWIPLASLIINALVRLSKTDQAVAWFPVNIRPRVRPTAALVLGVASGVVAGLAGGSWGSALVGGFIAGMLAITTHDVVVESIRKGRDIGIPKRQPAPAMFPPGSIPP